MEFSLSQFSVVKLGGGGRQLFEREGYPSKTAIAFIHGLGGMTLNYGVY
jgi:hypothetical protein